MLVVFEMEVVLKTIIKYSGQKELKVFRRFWDN